MADGARQTVKISGRSFMVMALWLWMFFWLLMLWCTGFPRDLTGKSQNQKGDGILLVQFVPQTLRPFWLRLCRARFFVVNNSG
jgi:hypothetical protein